MSFLQINDSFRNCAEIRPYIPSQEESDYNERLKRDMRDDIRHGLDLLFKFKDELEKMHPGATEIIHMLCR